LPNIDPWYRGYTGKIESSGDSKYTSWGNIIEEKKTKVVNELPIGMWTDNFKEYLDDLLEEKVIKKVKNYSTPKIVKFVITEEDDGLVCDVKNLKLYKYIYTSNMVLFDSKGKITKYRNVDEIINEFCQVRLVYYTKRKNYMIQNLNNDIKFLGNKRRFLEEVMTGDIKLFDDKGKTRKSRKTLDIFKDLEKRGYDKEIKESKNKQEEDEDDIENDEKSNGYDYLLRLQFRSITEEKINKLKNDIDSKIKIRDTLSNTTEKELWIQDLDEFQKAYVKWVKDVEKEVVKTNKK
jgi:DNA topoisomerase-2